MKQQNKFDPTKETHISSVIHLMTALIAINIAKNVSPPPMEPIPPPIIEQLGL
jgi:hypothetical protein